MIKRYFYIFSASLFILLTSTTGVKANFEDHKLEALTRLTNSPPNGFNYQAVLRDNNGRVLDNSSVTMRFTLSNTADVWIETHTVTTDDYGMVALVIGSGTQTGGSATSFEAIDWSSAITVKVEADSGNGFVDLGTSDLQSVPYANFASNGITTAQADAITANTAKAEITPEQATTLSNISGSNTGDQDITGIAANATAIGLNTAKTGITTAQATEITANTAKAAITPEQATTLAATSGTNTGDQDITGIATNATAIALNTAKTGITPAQATEITANTAKVGVTPAEATTLAATSGTNTGDQDITGIVTNATAITLNTAKTGITTAQATEITDNTAKVGVTPAEATVLAATSGTNTGDQDITGIATNATAIGLNTAKTGITLAQATEITDNTAKVGITPAEVTVLAATSGTNTGDQDITGIATNATAIALNTAKTGITPAQEAEITDNTVKVGITVGQAAEIAANTAKTGGAFANTANVILAGDADDDFLFGSAQLTDAGNAGEDNRMFFDKSSGAFRVGSAVGTQWDSPGIFSFAAGKSNTASGAQTSIGGGYGNSATGASSTIGGGVSNIASYSVATVGGGSNNTASGQRSVISGGANNLASELYATVGGGGQNKALAKRATISGGNTNEISGRYSTIGGGWYNTVSGSSSTISGGRANTTSSMNSSIGGGYNNDVSGTSSFIGGGSNNTSSANYTALIGGRNNSATGNYSTIGGGYNNSANSYNSTVAGGRDNSAGDNATVAGGFQNIASGSFSSVSGGKNINAQALGEFATGLYSADANTPSATIFNASDRIFTIGNGTSTAARSNALVVLKNGNTDINGNLVANSLGIDGVFTLPTADGSAGQVLQTDGSGNVSWQTASGGGAFANTANVILAGDADDDFLFGSAQLADAGNAAEDKRMFFDKSNGAFRVGTAQGNQWDSRGTNSFAAGINNTAIGNSSTVSGGFGNTASSFYATIGGGYGNVASSYNSTVAGGLGNTSSGKRSGVIGGFNNTASGNYSSIGGGREVNAQSQGEFAVGLFSEDATTPNATGFVATDRIFTVGNGTADAARSNAMVILKNGNTDINGNLVANSLGVDGEFTLPNADGTAGQVLQTDGSGAVSWQTASGGASYAGTGTDSFVAGASNNIASGIFSSISGGSNNTSSANGSTVAGGRYNTSSSQYSSVSGGFYNIASGDFSSVGGGYRVRAHSLVEFAIGMNSTDAVSPNSASFVGTDRIFTIGNGTSDLAKSNALVILKNGNATLAGALTQNSDRRLKREIEPLGNTLDKVNEMEGVTYKWNNLTPRDTTEANIGLIAQEVEALFPELVKTGDNGYKSVNYIQLVPVLIEAIKELSKENDALETANAKMEQRQQGDDEKFTALEAKLDYLMRMVTADMAAKKD